MTDKHDVATDAFAKLAAALEHVPDASDAVLQVCGHVVGGMVELEQRVQDLANPPSPAQPHGTARSEVHQAPITDHAGEGGEPSIAELERWRLSDAWLPFGRANMQLVEESAHEFYSDQLASLRSALADAERERDLLKSRSSTLLGADISTDLGVTQAVEKLVSDIDRIAELERQSSVDGVRIRDLETTIGIQKKANEELKSRIADLEAIATSIEPSDEEILAVYRETFGRSFGTVNQSRVAAMRAVLALTRPPEGAVSWSDKAVVNGTLKSQWASTTERPESEALKPFQLGTRGTVHCVFVPTETKEQSDD